MYDPKKESMEKRFWKGSVGNMSIQESKAEKMLGIFFVVLGILLVVAISPWQIAAVETEWYNAPRFFPYVISGLMILLGVLLSWSGAKKKNMEGQETYSISKNGLMSVVVTLLLICIYVGALHFIPYLPCTIVALGALMWFFGQRDLRKLIPIAVILPVIVYFGFTELLKLRLP